MFAPDVLAGNLQDLAAKANPSVVLLTLSDGSGRKMGTGTGFFVSSDGRVVTNHHVIAGAAKVTATLSDGRKVESLGIMADDEEKDLAIVKVPGEGYQALTLGDSRTIRAGDEIVVIGSPMGLSGTLSTGIVSAIRDERALAHDEEDDPGGSNASHTRSWRIQVTAAISPGSSGSPIMSPTGLVVAVAVGQRVGGQGLNFGVPSEEVRSLLDRVAPGAKLAPFTSATRSSVRKSLAISAAFFGALAVFYFAFKLHEKYKRPRKRAGPPPRPS